MDVVSLSQSAIAYLTPYLLHATGKTVEEGLDIGREKLFQWLQAKFLSISQKDALVRAQELPEDEEILDTLRYQLEREMKENPAFMEEIRDLLPKEKSMTNIKQTQINTGNNITSTQVIGYGNVVIK
ncbi:hypothetical protein LZ24_02609 [Desulfobotulus alkaliphilus]|uniref:Uncharacterized protein n=1 Tax=Desulfobotulus alkaliphilus TaxID=622671 RepID=A0A562RGC5_9BACT|nr:hypothetical protein [Desulfobotulus alkaliphilus]TWI68129.1 hypothetical protein LZ24_02609 [Desulfobotulus alkaliphilus]